MTTPTTRTTRRKPACSPTSGPQAQARSCRQAYNRRKARAKVKSEALRQREAAQVEALPVQHPHAAGIDIGSRSHWVCAGFTAEADSGLIREFPAHTAALTAETVVIDYETFARIRDCRDRQGPTIAQIAQRSCVTTSAAFAHPGARSF